METNDLTRPPFFVMFLEETKRRYTEGGALKILPVWIGLISILSFLFSTMVPDAFWGDPAKSLPFYAGILTLDGLLLALAWSAFAKIFENICTPTFISYLRKGGMISRYTYHVSYVHATQIAAVGIAGLGLLLLICDGIPIWINRLELVLTVSTSVYAVKEAVGSTTTMYDLIWYRSIYETDLAQRTQANIASISDGFRPKG